MAKNRIKLRRFQTSENRYWSICGDRQNVVVGSVFFSREKKSCPWKPFLAFFSIFSRAIFVFHGQFFAIFLVFSRAKKWLSRAKIDFFSSFTGNFLFSRAKIKFFGGFTGNFVLSRAIFWVFFTGKVLVFTGKKKTLPYTNERGARV